MKLLNALVVGVLMVGLALAGPSPRAADADGVPGRLAGEVVVKLAPGANLNTLATTYHLDATPIEQSATGAIYRLRIADGAEPETRTLEMTGDGDVIYVEPNYVSQAPEARFVESWAVGGNSSAYVAQWAPQKIGLPAAHAVTRGAGMNVAVLDTGVDMTHPALAGKLLPGYDFVENDDDPSEGAPTKSSPAWGHGTHVAGLVALAAPDAKITPYRVLDRNGVGSVFRVTQALMRAINPPSGPPADVINLSLSTSLRSKLMRDVIAAVTCASPSQSGDLPCLSPTGRGAVVVAAVGNAGGVQPEYPAGDSVGGLISVGATTSADTLAGFSNRGSWVTVLAPGEQILSSVPGGLYGVWRGTSMAAPLVAGEAALVRAAFPATTTGKVVQHIENTSANLGSQIGKRVDAYAAVTTPPGEKPTKNGVAPKPPAPVTNSDRAKPTPTPKPKSR